MIKLRRKRRTKFEHLEYVSKTDAVASANRLLNDPTIKVMVMLGRYMDTDQFFLVKVLK